MRWTKSGAQMLLHARYALINGELSKLGAGRGGMNSRYGTKGGCGLIEPATSAVTALPPRIVATSAPA
jgi:hypothetical protein